MKLEKDWERQEKNQARKHKGRRTPGSGAHYYKGDVIGNFFLVECKHRNSKNAKGNFIDLQKEWLIKIEKEAREAPGPKKLPLLSINIGNKAQYSILLLSSWLDICGLEKEIARHVYLEDQKQVRMCSTCDYAFTAYHFHEMPMDTISVSHTDKETWIVLPESEVALMITILQKEETCQNISTSFQKASNKSWKKRNNLPKASWKRPKKSMTN